MTYREAFDHTGKPRRRFNVHRLINVLLALACIVIWAGLTEGWTA